MPPSSAARNEQAKLSATYVNNIAVAVMALGLLTPVFTTWLGTGTPGSSRLEVPIICFGASIALHVLARLILRRITP